jgi:hypothetical protein
MVRELITPSATSSFAARVATEREGHLIRNQLCKNALGSAHSIGANCKLAMRAVRPKSLFLDAQRVLNFREPALSARVNDRKGFLL